MHRKSKIIIPIIVIAILLALVAITAFIYFSTPTFVVSFDPDGGNMSTTQIEVRLGESYSLPRPTKVGYTFYGWYYNGKLINENGNIWEIEENITLVAKWKISYGDFVFDVGSDGLILVDCKSTFKSNVIVPDSYNGMPVVAIADGAFENTTKLINQESMSFTTLFLPLSIKSIGANAFASCQGLKVSMYTSVDGEFKEISDLGTLFAWSETVMIGEGNSHLLDVATQVRPAFGWFAYTSALYYVKLDANGGTLEENGKELRRNKSYELPIPVRDGFVFDGWYYGETKIEPSGANWGYAKHMRLIAKWIENEKEGD